MWNGGYSSEFITQHFFNVHTSSALYVNFSLITHLIVHSKYIWWGPIIIFSSRWSMNLAILCHLTRYTLSKKFSATALNKIRLFISKYYIVRTRTVCTFTKASRFIDTTWTLVNWMETLLRLIITERILLTSLLKNIQSVLNTISDTSRL